jgi:hypothetical protein
VIVVILWAFTQIRYLKEANVQYQKFYKLFTVKHQEFEYENPEHTVELVHKPLLTGFQNSEKWVLYTT